MEIDLSGRHIFMAGGTGFVGKTILDHLDDLYSKKCQQFRVTVLSRNPEIFLDQYRCYGNMPWLYFIRGSLEKLPNPANGYTDVIHAAADTHMQGQETEWIQQIVNGTQSMLQFAVQSGAKRFLLTSSGAIYGPQPADIAELDEDYGGAPSTALISSTYGQAKRVAEQLCTVFYQKHGIETISARCFAFAGKHLPLDGPYAFGNFIRDALYGDAIRVKGDGTAVRSYLDAEDMAHWLISLLCNGRAGETYNVGANYAVSMRDLAMCIAKVLAPNKPVIIENSSAINTFRSLYVPSIKKVEELGLYPQFTLEETIQRVANALDA